MQRANKISGFGSIPACLPVAHGMAHPLRMCWAAVLAGILWTGGVRCETFRGRVVSETGAPVAGVGVRWLGTRDATTGARPELAGTRSGDDGSFACEVAGSAPLLELSGPLGTGRLRLAQGTDRHALRYPVQTTVVLLHDNDLHFNFNHRAMFEGEVARLRAANANVFLLNAGDVFIRNAKAWNGQPKEFYAEHGLAIVAWMNSLRYDAMTLGNHDVDYIDGLTRDALATARFPLLAANLRITTDLLPQPRPFTVLTTDNDLDLVVLGLTTVNFQKPGVGFVDPYQAYLACRRQLPRHQALVLLTHLGLPVDQLLARTTQDVDVILGGHCHTVLAEAQTVNGVLIGQAGGTPADRPLSVDPTRPKYLGIATLVFENERLVRKEGRVLTFAGE